ncbi:MAG: TonB-dependent receptor, partial [Pseudomonadota bacterium]
YIINGSDTDVDPETGLGFIVDPGTIPLVSGRDPSASIDFSKIEDTYQDAGLDFKLPLFFGGREILLKAGYAYTDNERDSLNRQYFYTGFSTIANQCNDTRLNGGDAAQRIDRLLDDAFLSSGACGSTPPIRIDQTPNNTDFPGETLGTLQVHAGYFGLDAQVNDFVRTALGVRFEDGEQTSETIFFDSVSDSRVVFSAPVIEEEYFLPAATVTWNFADNLQLRVGYSETITRPQFREKSPNIFLNTETERSFVGNPFLENAEIKNYDARLEWYFGREEFITLGAFYKDLENPIEEIGRSVANESDVTTFINTPQAELYGAEFEFEKRFELYDFAQRFAEGSALSEWTSSKDLYFAVNYTYTSSEVQAGSEPVNLAAPLATGLGFVPLEISAENLIQDGRALQGQSDHLLNIQFGYEDLDVNSKATLLLNYASERIREAGTLLVGADTPDVIEEPPLTLDFVYTRGFEVWGGEYEVGFKAQNILGEEYKAFSEGRGEVPVEEYDLGQTFAISLKRKF